MKAIQKYSILKKTKMQNSYIVFYRKSILDPNKLMFWNGSQFVDRINKALFLSIHSGVYSEKLKLDALSKRTGHAYGYKEIIFPPIDL